MKTCVPSPHPSAQAHVSRSGSSGTQGISGKVEGSLSRWKICAGWRARQRWLTADVLGTNSLLPLEWRQCTKRGC